MLRITALLLGSLVAVSCSHKVQDIDPNNPENINLAFGFDDLKTIATDMTQSFLDSNAWGGDRPRIVFGGIQNRTTQHIDTVNITDTISTALIQSQKFTVLAGEQGIGEIDNEVAYQQSGAVDLASAAELGKQLGAEYVFYGRFTEIRKQRKFSVQLCPKPATLEVLGQGSDRRLRSADFSLSQHFATWGALLQHRM